MNDSFVITTRFDGGKYVASVDERATAFSCINAHKAAQKAAGDGYSVKEIKPNVFRATPIEHEPTY